MYREKKILAFVPARGSSKGIPHKNIINLCGKPLISYTIESALGCKYIDYVLVSTDDEEIASISRECGAEVPFMRPAGLATDTSKTIDAVLHSIKTLREMGEVFDLLILLQPTQPLRTREDICDSIEKYIEAGCSSLVSVSKVDDHPLLIRSIEDNNLIPLLNMSSTCRRQDMPNFYRVNGCIYINSINQIDENTSFNDNNFPYIMDRSHSVDIDEFCDLAIAEYYLKKRQS